MRLGGEAVCCTERVCEAQFGNTAEARVLRTKRAVGQAGIIKRGPREVAIGPWGVKMEGLKWKERQR